MKRLNLKRILVAGGLIAILLFGVGRLVGGSVTPHLYTGTVLQDSSPAPALDGLAFSDGTPADLTAFEDELVLLYFGYANCPDVCPTALADASTALRQLDSSERERVNLVMITVDPDRDTQPELQRYVEFFDPEFQSLSGTREDIDRAASQYGVFYEIGEGTAETGYLVDHTATMLGIDGGGSLRVVWPPTVTPSQLREDIKELLK